jgi:hypothetical protein
VRAPLRPGRDPSLRNQSAYTADSVSMIDGLSFAWLARSDACRSGVGHRNIGKDRRRPSQGDGLVRKFGHYDAAGPPSQERSKGEQSQRCETHLAEIVAWSLPLYARAIGVNCRSASGVALGSEPDCALSMCAMKASVCSVRHFPMASLGYSTLKN